MKLSSNCAASFLQAKTPVSANSTIIHLGGHDRRGNHYRAVGRRQSAGIVSAISLRSPINDQRVT